MCTVKVMAKVLRDERELAQPLSHTVLAGRTCSVWLRPVTAR